MYFTYIYICIDMCVRMQSGNCSRGKVEMLQIYRQQPHDHHHHRKPPWASSSIILVVAIVAVPTIRNIVNNIVLIIMIAIVALQEPPPPQQPRRTAATIIPVPLPVAASAFRSLAVAPDGERVRFQGFVGASMLCLVYRKGLWS